MCKLRGKSREEGCREVGDTRSGLGLGSMSNACPCV